MALSSSSSSSTALKLISSKRSSITETVLNFNTAFKDLDNHFDFLEKKFENAFAELQVKEDRLDSLRQSLSESTQEYGSLFRSLESRLEEQKRKEAEFELFQNEHFAAREEMMESRFADLQSQVEERIDDACLKEKTFYSKVDLTMTDIDNCVDNLVKREKVLESKIKHFESCCEQCLEEYCLNKKRFESDKVSLDLQLGNLEHRQEEFVERLRKVNQMKELLGELVKEVEVERNYYRERNIETIDNDGEQEQEQASVVTRILANIDGSCLLRFLSKHPTEIDLMKKEVSDALNMLPDLGRTMIFAIMEEFQVQNVSSYRFVLEMLVGKIPNEIIESQDVQSAARKVALEWKEEVDLLMDPKDILGFLQLVCTYKLTSEFDHDELYNLCRRVVGDDCNGHVPELSEILSRSEKDPVNKILNVFQDKIDRRNGNDLDLFLQSSNLASLLPDAMQCCFDSEKGDMEDFLPILKEMTKVEIDTRGDIEDEAFDLALIGNQDCWILPHQKLSVFCCSYQSTNWDLGLMTRSFYVVSLIVKATFMGTEISTFLGLKKC